LSYTTITKNSCFWLCCCLCTMQNALLVISNWTWLDLTKTWFDLNWLELTWILFFSRVKNRSIWLSESIKIKIKILGFECQTSGTYAKRAKQATRKDNCLCFLNYLASSAGSRSGCFHTTLGCKPRSLIRVSLGWFDYSKKCEEGRSNSG
jgi:hypothetical protein